MKVWLIIFAVFVGLGALMNYPVIGGIILGCTVAALIILLILKEYKEQKEFEAQQKAKAEKEAARKAAEEARKKAEAEKEAARKAEEEARKKAEADRLAAWEALKEKERKKNEGTVQNIYKVAGVSYYLKNLLSVMEPNYLYNYKKQDLIDTCNYDVNIYKTALGATKLELIHEEDNPHDPNAVMVTLGGKLVGYIAAADCKHVLEIIDKELLVSAKAEATGGKYKRVNEDYDFARDKSTYTMEYGEDEYEITLYIREKVTE